MTTYPDRPGFKTTDPETSAAAADSVSSRAATLRQKVLECLRGADMTADEVAELLGESVLAVRPRVSELRKAGKVEKTAGRRANVSGQTACVWRAVGGRAVQQEMVM